MKKVKQLKKWGIFENSPKEIKEHGFTHTVIHPDSMGTGLLSPRDSDWECNSLEDAIDWIEKY